MQIDILRRLKEGGRVKGLKMAMVGSVRGREDEALLEGLREYAKQEGVDDMLEFKVNQDFS